MECNQRRWTKGVNTFERVQNSELSEKITKIKLRKSQKIKLHVTSFEFISFWVIVVSFFLFICHKSHTTEIKTVTSQVGVISKAQKAQLSKIA